MRSIGARSDAWRAGFRTTDHPGEAFFRNHGGAGALEEALIFRRFRFDGSGVAGSAGPPVGMAWSPAICRRPGRVRKWRLLGGARKNNYHAPLTPLDFIANPEAARSQSERQVRDPPERLALGYQATMPVSHNIRGVGHDSLISANTAPRCQPAGICHIEVSCKAGVKKLLNKSEATTGRQASVAGHLGLRAFTVDLCKYYI